MLKLVTPLGLPEGALVSVIVVKEGGEATGETDVVGLAYPTKMVSAMRLDDLTDLVGLGGDALADSEALYD